MAIDTVPKIFIKPKLVRPVSETRKIRKPLMERKRRERINSSLERLAMLLKEANLVAPDKPITKLEKADILELTVRHLTNLKEHNSKAACKDESNSTLSNWKSSFDSNHQISDRCVTSEQKPVLLVRPNSVASTTNESTHMSSSWKGSGYVEGFQSCLDEVFKVANDCDEFESVKDKLLRRLENLCQSVTSPQNINKLKTNKRSRDDDSTYIQRKKFKSLSSSRNVQSDAASGENSLPGLTLFPMKLQDGSVAFLIQGDTKLFVSGENGTSPAVNREQTLCMKTSEQVINQSHNTAKNNFSRKLQPKQSNIAPATRLQQSSDGSSFMTRPGQNGISLSTFSNNDNARYMITISSQTPVSKIKTVTLPIGTVSATSAPHTTGTVSATSAPHTTGSVSATSAPHATGTVSATSAPHTTGSVSATSAPHTTGTVSATSAPHTTGTVSSTSAPHTTGSVSTTSAPHTTATVRCTSVPRTTAAVSSLSAPHTTATVRCTSAPRTTAAVSSLSAPHTTGTNSSNVSQSMSAASLNPLSEESAASSTCQSERRMPLAQSKAILPNTSTFLPVINRNQIIHDKSQNSSGGSTFFLPSAGDRFETSLAGSEGKLLANKDTNITSSVAPNSSSHFPTVSVIFPPTPPPSTGVAAPCSPPAQPRDSSLCSSPVEPQAWGVLSYNDPGLICLNAPSAENATCPIPSLPGAICFVPACGREGTNEGEVALEGRIERSSSCLSLVKTSVNLLTNCESHPSEECEEDEFIDVENVNNFNDCGVELSSSFTRESGGQQMWRPW